MVYNNFQLLETSCQLFTHFGWFVGLDTSLQKRISAHHGLTLRLSLSFWMESFRSLCFKKKVQLIYRASVLLNRGCQSLLSWSWFISCSSSNRSHPLLTSFFWSSKILVGSLSSMPLSSSLWVCPSGFWVSIKKIKWMRNRIFSEHKRKKIKNLSLN